MSCFCAMGASLVTSVRLAEPDEMLSPLIFLAIGLEAIATNGAKGISTSKDATNGAPGLATSKKLLGPGTKGIATKGARMLLACRPSLLGWWTSWLLPTH